MEVDSEITYKVKYGECRCCLASGRHRDIMAEYYHNGVSEVYYDIFMETFSLVLSKARSLSLLICAQCITRLRDAQSFRALAVRTERHLLGLLKKNMEFVDGVKNVIVNNYLYHRFDRNTAPSRNKPVGHKSNDADVKREMIMKYEYSDDFVLEHAYDSDFLSNDELVEEAPQPNLVQGEAALLARFSNVKRLPTRADLCKVAPNFAKHLDRLKNVEMSTRNICSYVHMMASPKQPEHEQSAPRDLRCAPSNEKAMQMYNAVTLIRCSNMTPFRSRFRNGFPCFYCRTVYEQFNQLKEHTQQHKHSELTRVLKRYGPESLIVYADIRNLTCMLCYEAVHTIVELKKHLTNKHGKSMYGNDYDRVVPYILDDEVYVCQICSCRFETFGAIERHMNGHYRNYVCKECGNGYVTKYRLKVHHKAMHVSGRFPCEICNKIFTTDVKRRNHDNQVHKMKKRFKCSKCGERFAEYFRRQRHLVQIHGQAPLKYNCNVCDRTFGRRYTLSRHLKRDHLEEREHECDICNYRCYTKNELKAHMVKHTGQRVYECSVCKKSYARKKTLREHMRIHNNERRFVCPACGQAFVQKCSLKGHMNTHHFEYSLP